MIINLTRRAELLIIKIVMTSIAERMKKLIRYIHINVKCDNCHREMILATFQTFYCHGCGVVKKIAPKIA